VRQREFSRTRQTQLPGRSDHSVSERTGDAGSGALSLALARRGDHETLKLLTPVRAVRCVRLGRSDQGFPRSIVREYRSVRQDRSGWCPICVQLDLY
jgi:hypothetical protein